MNYTAEQIIKILDLAEHPTCGFTKETYRSNDVVPEGILRAAFRGTRPLGSVLYFLITADASMALHRVIADQMYHHYLGDPVEVLLLFKDGNGKVERVGSDLVKGMRPQLLIPGSTLGRFL
jgi:predicted cupin superfamily sugar epimerase